MFSFLSSAGNKIMETFQDLSYFDRDEMTKINAKYVPGLELQYLQEYDSTKSAGFSKEVGMFYKLKFGEVGARFVCESNPIAHFTGTLRLNSRLTSYELTSMGVVDVNKRKLHKWNIGLTMIAGNLSGHLKLHADEFVFSTRHRIHPRFVSLTENRSPYRELRHRRSTLAMGFEFSSRLALEVMVSHFQPPTFALQYHCSNPQRVVRVSGDVYSNRAGVSIAFHPSSFFSLITRVHLCYVFSCCLRSNPIAMHVWLFLPVAFNLFVFPET